MGVTGKLEVEIDIKHSGDVFHELFGTNPHQLPNIVPDKVHGCDLHEGEFGKVGSILEWAYTLDGKKCIAKQEVEVIDEENKMVRFKVIGGDLLDDFKSMTVTFHVIPKGEFDAVKWDMEFERFEDHGPYPISFMDLAITVTRDIEAHHLNASLIS